MLVIYTDQPHLWDRSFPGSLILRITVLKYWQKVKFQTCKAVGIPRLFSTKFTTFRWKRKSYYLLPQIVSALWQRSGCFLSSRLGGRRRAAPGRSPAADSCCPSSLLSVNAVQFVVHFWQVPMSEVNCFWHFFPFFLHFSLVLYYSLGKELTDLFMPPKLEFPPRVCFLVGFAIDM